MEYLVFFEKSNDNTIWARVPDLDGCYSCGDSIEDAKENVRDAIALYLEDLKEDGKALPIPSLIKAELIEV